MKKMIIAAAIVCAAAFAQASTVVWGLGSAIDSETYSAGTAYLICATDLARPTLTGDDAAKEWFTANSDKLDTVAFRKASIVNGMVNETEDIAEAIGRKNYWLVIVNESADHMAMSTSTKALNITTSAMTVTATWANTQTASYEIVPEPTSGLLLLLGMAGLALKRKRA